MKNLALACMCLAFSSQIFAQGALKYARDDRPVDGLEVVLELKPLASGRFDATFTTTYFDRVEGELVTTTRLLAESLNCRFDEQMTVCERDDRPVDGPRFILSVVQVDQIEGYTATFTTDTASWLGSSHKVENLAQGLKVID